ncbi:PQQ-binding-like beta-propeller repeat protein [bacterium]|nr:PQQ-binding-like beta-propeller repeat protein [bacterium]
MKYYRFIFFLAIICLPLTVYAGVDSLWFSEETACNDSNIVTICYELTADTTDIDVQVSSDGGSTWDVPLSTLRSHAGDLGSDILPGIHCFEWIMSEDLPGVESYDFKASVFTSSDQYEYWVPYVSTHTGCASGNASRLYVRGVYNTTNIDIDFDHDDIIDSSFVLNVNETQSFSIPLLESGTHIITNKPIQSYYYFHCSNHGLYEDGSMSYALYPSNVAGWDYAVFPADYTTVLAIENATTVFVDSDYDGTSDFSFVLNRGEVNTFSTISHAAHIYSANEKKIVVVNAFHSGDYYSTTSAYNLLPVDLLGMEYYAPEVHNYTLTVVSLDSRVEVIAVQSGTNLTINGTPYTPALGEMVTFTTEAEVTITSDKPVAATHIADIFATDPWGSHENRHYMYAFNLFPEDILSERYILPQTGGTTTHGFPKVQYSIISFSDGNFIELDLLDDGSIDTSFTLHEGDIGYFHEGEYVPFNSSFLSLQSSSPVQVTYSYRGWWSNRSETTQGRIIISGGWQERVVGAGPLDSRKPEITIDCPSNITPREMNTISWTVDDLFWTSQPCSVHIFGCGIDERYAIPWEFITWSTPDVTCDACTMVVAVPDSFCNWGYDTCVFSIERLLPPPDIDTVWFWEETDCNDSNIVHICYVLTGDTTTVSVRMSSDGGATWTVPLLTLRNDAGDLGPGVAAGTHCFDWLMSEDFPDYERHNFMVEVSIGGTTGGGSPWRMFQCDAQHTGRSPNTRCEEPGTVLWSYDAGATIKYPAVYTDTLIYFTTTDGILHALNTSGDSLWAVDFGSASDGGPLLLHDGRIVVCNLDNQVKAFLPDGTVDWIYNSPTAINGIHHCPILGGDSRIYVNGFYDAPWHGHLISLTQEGSENWNVSFPGSGSWAICSPAMDNDNLLFTVDMSNSPGELVCWNNGGGVQWRFTAYPYGGETDLRSSAAVDVSRNRVYFGSNKNDPRGMVAVDYTATTNSLAWFYDAGAGNDVNYSPAIDPDGNIYFGSSNGTFYSLNPAGGLRWSASFSGNITDPIIDPEDHVISGTASGYLYVYNTDGDSLWSILLDGSIVSSPIIGSNGVIYAGTNSGNFYAIGGCASSAAETATANLDSRHPAVEISSCPILLEVGESNLFSWTVEDSFWVDPPCSVHFFGCGIDERYLSRDVFFNWSASSYCEACTLIVAARDSFCNWGYDTCVFTVSPGDTPPYLESVSFWEETERDNRNLVNLCYKFSDMEYDVATLFPFLSGNNGVTWTVPMDSILDTLSAYGSPNLQECVEPGYHCFQWVMSEDLPDSEACQFRAQMQLTSAVVSDLELSDSLDMLFPRGGAGGGGLAWHGEYIYVCQYRDTVFEIEASRSMITDTFIIDRSVGIRGLEDLAFCDGYLFVNNAWAVYKYDLSTESVLDSSRNIGSVSASISGMTCTGTCGSEEAFIWVARSNFWFYKLRVSDLSIVDSFSIPALPEPPEGLAYAYGYLWCLLDDATLLKIDTDSEIIIAAFAMPYYDASTGSGPEGLTFDGTNFWYAELGATDRVYKVAVDWYRDSIISEPGCLDSRNPLTIIDSAICFDTLVSGGTDTLSWDVFDDFVFPTTPCSVYVSFDDGYSFAFLGMSDNDSSYIWSPVFDTLTHTARFLVTLYDSFGNYSLDTSCMFTICVGNDPPVITNVEFFQRTDGSQIVDIYYDLDDPNGDSVYVTVEFSSDGGITWDIVPLTYIAPSDTGWVPSIPAGERRIIWDMSEDTDPCTLEESDIILRITGDDGRTFICE